MTNPNLDQDDYTQETSALGVVTWILSGFIFLYIYSFIAFNIADLAPGRPFQFDYLMDLAQFTFIVLFIVVLARKIVYWMLPKFDQRVRVLVSLTLIYSIGLGSAYLVSEVRSLNSNINFILALLFLPAMIFLAILSQRLALPTTSTIDAQKLSDPRLSIYDFSDKEFLAWSNLSEKKAAVVTDLHSRAADFLNRARRILLIIILVLLSAALFVVFAEKILALGAVQADPIAKMESERDVAHDRIWEINRNLEKLEDEQQSDMLLSPEVQPSARQLYNDTRERELASLAKENDRLDRLEDKILAARERVHEAIVTLGSAGGAGGLEFLVDPRLIAAAVVTRLGVALIAVYLVQVLLNLYRYNTQVAAHYRAQADSIILSDLSASKIKSLQTAFLPDVKYGKMPKAEPARTARNAVRNANPWTRRRRRKKNGKTESPVGE